jgi:hypothetical protein
MRLGYRDRRAAAGHRRPLSGLCLVNMLTDQSTQMSRLSRKALGQNYDVSERAGFLVDLDMRPILVAPRLRRKKRNEQPEHDAERRQQRW